MPMIAPLSEFNRNQSEVIASLAKSGEPMYLTRNGSAAVVVMDAEAFDRRQARLDEARRSEEQTYALLMRGYQDVLTGNTSSLDDADARIRSQKGWL